VIITLIPASRLAGQYLSKMGVSTLSFCLCIGYDNFYAGKQLQTNVKNILVKCKQNSLHRCNWSRIPLKTLLWV